MITSTRHPLVAAFRRLAARPARGNRLLLDEPDLIAEALAAGVSLEDVLVVSPAPPALAALAARARACGARVREAPARVVQAAATVTTSQGIVATARRPAVDAERVLARPDLLLLVADGIGDPGNLGTMVRTALAAGASGVAVTGPAADPFQPKALRASAGAAFRLPVWRTEAEALRARLRGAGAKIVVAHARGAEDFRRVPLAPPVALVVGSEAHGVETAWLAAAGAVVRIPLYGPVESLNAAVAAALLLYEAARQRDDAARERR